jgi:hypothetical protein
MSVDFENDLALVFVIISSIGSLAAVILGGMRLDYVAAYVPFIVGFIYILVFESPTYRFIGRALMIVGACAGMVELIVLKYVKV